MSACVHRWVLESPRAGVVPGRCRACGESREFPSESGRYTGADGHSSGKKLPPLSQRTEEEMPTEKELCPCCGMPFTVHEFYVAHIEKKHPEWAPSQAGQNPPASEMVATLREEPPPPADDPLTCPECGDVRMNKQSLAQHRRHCARLRKPTEEEKRDATDKLGALLFTEPKWVVTHEADEAGKIKFGTSSADFLAPDEADDGANASPEAAGAEADTNAEAPAPQPWPADHEHDWLTPSRHNADGGMMPARDDEIAVCGGCGVLRTPYYVGPQPWGAQLVDELLPPHRTVVDLAGNPVPMPTWATAIDGLTNSLADLQRSQVVDAKHLRELEKRLDVEGGSRARILELEKRLDEEIDIVLQPAAIQALEKTLEPRLTALEKRLDLVAEEIESFLATPGLDQPERPFPALEERYLLILLEWLTGREVDQTFAKYLMSHIERLLFHCHPCKLSSDT